MEKSWIAKRIDSSPRLVYVVYGVELEQTNHQHYPLRDG